MYVVQVMEELANVNALYSESKIDLEQNRNNEAELEELREMKADIERKEKGQAVIIQNQASTRMIAKQPKTNI